MSRVIVVGAGIAGIACARELVAAGISVSVRERAGTVGGRMASPRINGRPVDVGAAYFTARDPDFVAQAEDWCARGLARRWTDRFATLDARGLGAAKEGPWRYATCSGLRSLVHDLAGQGRPAPAVPLALRSPVSVVESGPAVDGEPADAVVLAMPDPQVRRIVSPHLSAIHTLVSSRPWEAALTLTASYPRRTWPADFDGAFINDDATLAWVADDGRRRADLAPVLVTHSTAGFAARQLGAPQEAAPAMAAALDRLLLCGAPARMRVHRWTFARPREPRDEPFHFGSDRVGLAGDGWGSPRIETAWLSGRALGRHIAAELAG